MTATSPFGPLVVIANPRSGRGRSGRTSPTATSRSCGPVEADPPLPIEADGEILGTTPATFEVVPGAVRIKV